MKNAGKKGLHTVKNVLPGSIAEEMEIAPGDVLLSVNGMEIEDILDYRFAMADTTLSVMMRDGAGDVYELDIEKEYEEDLGIEFENALMDDYHSCSNGCIFCFIDQMPPGMRKTLYFKDDDARLSFLMGNYITLTNVSDADIDRVCRYHLEPVNISIHTTDPELRVQMLRNKHAGEALRHIKTLKDAGITMNGQIVLCKGYNDGDALIRTIRDLSAYLPEMQSVSVVPVGLTKYREHLPELAPFTREDAETVIDVIEKWQATFLQEYGTRFLFASDEWYLLAGRDLPEEEAYEGYPQIENGVGMMRSFLREAYDAIDVLASTDATEDVTGRYLCATGELAFPFIRQITEKIEDVCPHLSVDVCAIRNEFFGPLITVTGLVVGHDLIAQIREILSKDASYDALLVPSQMLRADEDVFLDDVTLEEVRETLAIPVIVTPSGGNAFVRSLAGGLGIEKQNGSTDYEQTGRGHRRATERRKIDSF